MFNKFRNHFLPKAFFVILLVTNCLGIDGPDVIRGDKMVGKVLETLNNKVATCRLQTTLPINYPIIGWAMNQNQKLFYKTKDVDTCVNNITNTSCEILATRVLGTLQAIDLAVSIFCGEIEQNAIYQAPYFQGNFLNTIQ